jgi:hypothetical protein
MWLSYRCFTARGQERVPIFGDFGLANQLGNADLRSATQVPRALGTLAGFGAGFVAELYRRDQCRR